MFLEIYPFLLSQPFFGIRLFTVVSYPSNIPVESVVITPFVILFDILSLPPSPPCPTSGEGFIRATSSSGQSILVRKARQCGSMTAGP